MSKIKLLFKTVSAAVFTKIVTLEMIVLEKKHKLVTVLNIPCNASVSVT